MSDIHSKIKVRVRGLSGAPRALAEAVEPAFASIVDAAPREGTAYDLAFARAGAAEDHEIDCSGDDVVELRLEGDLCVYTSVARLAEGLLPLGQARTADSALVLPPRLQAAGLSRGGEGIAIEGFQILDIKSKLLEGSASLAGHLAAVKLAERLEDQLVGAGGLFRVRDIREAEQGRAREPPKAIGPGDVNASKAALIFIHGTASTTAGSFSDLWNLSNDTVWDSVIDPKIYGDNVFAFEHRTLTESPIQNARALVACLPAGLRVHLVSHSRGGLVGELLCRGQFVDGREAFTKDDLALFDDDNIYLERIFALGANRDVYQRHRNDLAALNGELQAAGLNIERFVRVACPARGTTLASGKLDLYLSTLLNLAGLIPALRTTGIYDFLRAFTLAAAKQRTSPEFLPGLEAMMPGSPLIALLNGTRDATAAHLAVIAGDIEPSGILKKLAIALVDRFYQSEHDLVVNTPSMDGGARRSSPVPLLERRGRDVNHFSYFVDRESRQGLRSALELPGKTLPAGFRITEQPPTVIARSLPRGRKSGEVATVFILPGISGSHIERDGRRIWIDFVDLLRGRFTDLSIDAENVAADGPVAMLYGDLAGFLGRSHEVIPFAYDWRQSLLDASRRLAAAIDERLRNSAQPVRIVAHSMGGLVARGMMAVDREVWDRMRGRTGSRVLMLGTPNSGSHSILRLLANQDRLIKWLAGLDIRHNAYDLLNILSRFPGVLELLPVHDDAVFRTAFWQQFEVAMGSDGNTRWRRPTQAALRNAERTWRTLAEAALDPQHVFYLAGRARETPVAVDASDGRVRFQATPRGDGQVPWETGIPQGIKHWFVDAVHGDLPRHRSAFEAIQQILERGATPLLATRPPLARSAETRVEMREDSAEMLPSEAMLIKAALGASLTRYERPLTTGPRVEVSVCHGNLRFTPHPIMVGHYKDDTIVNAEGELDNQLDGRLSELYRLGIYPGPLKTCEIQIDRLSRFPGAVIVGLGEVGQLSPDQLTETYREALLRFALRFRQIAQFRDRDIEVSSLLVGSGAGGLAVEDALEAMLRGAMQANVLLAGRTCNRDKTIRKLQFIELYEDVAVRAQRGLQKILTAPGHKSRVGLADKIQSGEGGLRRISGGEDAQWWQRLRISGRDDGGLDFNPVTNRARMPMRTQPTQLSCIESFLEAATRDTSAQSKVGRVLFELLVPRDFKHYARQKNKLVLVVDERTAIYPWELIRYGGRDGDEAIALQAGLIRQLTTADDEHGELSHNGRALVVGDPTSNFPELPGAQQEASLVHELLDDGMVKSTLLLRHSSTDILTHLTTEAYQVLHLAGHGAFEYTPPGFSAPMTGMVIGENQFLTPALIRSMPTTPELVFINCCHLGRIEAGQSPAMGRVHRVAANLATQLIRQGVRAVIAAGWEVDDAAALTFARTFYRQLLAGEPFGDAIFKARLATCEQHPAVDTWGAYQCYGDHGYRLERGLPASSVGGRDHHVCLSEAIVEVENIFQEAKTASETRASELRDRLQAIEEQAPADWLEHGALLAALAESWGELGDFTRAIAFYTRALHAERALGSLRAIEQRANFQAREALRLAEEACGRSDNGNQGSPAQRLDRGRELLLSAEQDVASLIEACGASIERLSVLGAIAKRRAAFTALTEAGGKAEILQRIDEMIEAYTKSHRMAMEKNGLLYAYPLVNALTAQWLAVKLDGRRKLPATFYDSLRQAEASQSVPELNREYFWQAINREDCALLRSLAQGRFAEDCQALCEAYRAMLRVAASPRQFGSVRENLRFLAIIVSRSGDTDTAELLQELGRRLPE